MRSPSTNFLETEGEAYNSYLFTWTSSVETTANVAQYFMRGGSLESYLSGMAIDATAWQDLAEEYLFRIETEGEQNTIS